MADDGGDRFWQRPYAYAGERIGPDGPVVGSQHRSQTSLSARLNRRAARGLATIWITL